MKIQPRGVSILSPPCETGPRISAIRYSQPAISTSRIISRLRVKKTPNVNHTYITLFYFNIIKALMISKIFIFEELHVYTWETYTYNEINIFRLVLRLHVRTHFSLLMHISHSHLLYLMYTSLLLYHWSFIPDLSTIAAIITYHHCSWHLMIWFN